MTGDNYEQVLDAMFALGEQIADKVTPVATESEKEYLNKYYFAGEGALLLQTAARTALVHDVPLPSEILQFMDDDILSYRLVDDVKTYFAESVLA